MNKYALVHIKEMSPLLINLSEKITMWEKLKLNSEEFVFSSKTRYKFVVEGNFYTKTLLLTFYE